MLSLENIAKKAKPKLLILDHIGRLRESGKELIEGVRKGGFNGEVVIGKDLQVY